jgi:hypothetical protein
MNRVSAFILSASLLSVPVALLPPSAVAAVSVGVSVNVAPPPIPMYEQPPIPGPGYIWTPGYWAWSNAGYYYWVPGVWVLPPAVGVLWTPGWWGWTDGFYRWHPGYWGPRVGFYGGINYGYGYFGSGYVGGHWRGRDFYYNRAVNNIHVTNIRHVYVNKTVIHNSRGPRVSYNGGHGGTAARPTNAQRSYDARHHYAPTSGQQRQRETAERDHAQRFDANRGRPTAPARQYGASPKQPSHTSRPESPSRGGQPGVRPGQPQGGPTRPGSQPQPAARPEQRQPSSAHTPPAVRPGPPDAARALVPREHGVAARPQGHANVPSPQRQQHSNAGQRRPTNASRPPEARHGGGRPQGHGGGPQGHGGGGHRDNRG